MQLLELIQACLFVALPAWFGITMVYWVVVEHRGDRIPILLYHRLLSKRRADQGEVADSEMIYVTYDTSFAEQMRYLKDAGFTTLDFDDYCRIRSGLQPLPIRPVIITFDDGYLSNYTIGFPIIKALGLRATIFVIPEPNCYTRDRVAGIDDFITPSQILEMVNCGISVQSHTLTHPVLTELDDAAVERELAVSKELISKWTKMPVNHIAIPRAGYDRRVREIVARTGYQTACCNNKGSATGLSDPLALPRIVIERDMSRSEFASSLTSVGSAMVRLVGEIKRLPFRVGGPKLTRMIRPLLYESKLAPFFRVGRLKYLVMAIAGIYTIFGLYYWVGIVFRS